MEYDDKVRSKLGLAVCLRNMGDGTSRFFLDDVVADKETNTTSWQHDCFFTFSPAFDNEELDDLRLSEQDLQQLGVMVLARLLALNGRT
jgi:hypothetical protein